jgi:hypothetical protein
MPIVVVVSCEQTLSLEEAFLNGQKFRAEKVKVTASASMTEVTGTKEPLEPGDPGGPPGDRC